MCYGTACMAITDLVLFSFCICLGFFYKAAVLCFDLQVRELKCYMDVLSDLHKAKGCIRCTGLALAL